MITSAMQTPEACEIVCVQRGYSFLWKWRHVASDGGVTESDEAYTLFYEALSAARKNGYQPDKKYL
jgi:hypothetical protein